MAAATTQRPNAQDFLELVERGKRGRLKLYIGFAAGVGKTWRMLEEAHALRQRGVDVVGALVETHGRAETAALIRDLEVVPRRRQEYRGVTVEELDLEAVLARRPAVAVVDEIPHTNVPGSKNRKRYQDVLDLLAAGINVIGALNIQHLESLNDLIQRNTGVQVRETVPDSFLKQADQVVNLDLAVEDLLERLRAGKIYPSEKVGWALDHFFRDANLATLRELSLREVAESLDRTAAQAARVGEASAPARGRVLVALSSNPPRALTLLRRGSAARRSGRGSPPPRAATAPGAWRGSRPGRSARAPRGSSPSGRSSRPSGARRGPPPRGRGSRSGRPARGTRRAPSRAP